MLSVVMTFGSPRAPSATAIVGIGILQKLAANIPFEIFEGNEQMISYSNYSGLLRRSKHHWKQIEIAKRIQRDFKSK